MRGRQLARRAERLLTVTSDLLFEPGCLRCGGAGRPRQAAVCVDCWVAAGPGQTAAGTSARAMENTPPAAVICPACGEPACGVCPYDPPPWSWQVNALTYAGPARDLIMLYKFGPQGGRIRLAGPLAALLAATVRARGLHCGVDVVTAVPSHRRRTGERGFDAARVLARRLARRLALPPPRTLLARLDTAGPRARPAGTPAPAVSPGPARFQLRRRSAHRVDGATVLLVDDVVTTGTTLRRCAALLAAAGAGEVRVAVLARTPRHIVAARRTL